MLAYFDEQKNEWNNLKVMWDAMQKREKSRKASLHQY